jgi:hypothetical protein
MAEITVDIKDVYELEGILKDLYETIERLRHPELSDVKAYFKSHKYCCAKRDTLLYELHNVGDTCPVCNRSVVHAVHTLIGNIMFLSDGS